MLRQLSLHSAHNTWFPYGRRSYTAAVAGEPAIALHEVGAIYSGTPTVAIEAITLEIAVGTNVALIGPNGAGKSSLLKVIAGLLGVRQGMIRIFGLPIGACHHRVAYLSQRGQIDWRFPVTVYDMVMAGRYVHLGWLRRPGRDDHAAVAQVLERLDLQPLAQRQIGELSGGQQQRVLLARALVQGADLLMLDEPFNAVDATSRDVIVGVLADLRQSGKTALVATHELQQVADVFDRVVAMRDGRIVADTPAAFYQEDVRVL
ncbi:MAG TPA: ABC transporter ATP-binding protein [Roseiflexaceae bacterium]|nr:ABC transporter ATP-binding protein [Roseiflexaceae bacterium]HMP39791.1 ABC transporter ATP-binding protein [Roseiflexaceae bacterium]